ncbi:unnamed protein product [Rotaria magnacalcarata]|uniref:Uncharacterized protein n=2 Tax=Rotaria magnacalcarata TaxID=392030 RepID=A0A816XTT0_9BILA|nr:unnamed protein product [Rotaria magnacalcarata]
MSDTPSNINLTEQVLSFRNELFYDLVKQQCGTIALELMQVQDISSVDCLLEIGDTFSSLELDSDELISIKRKSGIFLNDGRFVLKKGLKAKVENFINTLHGLNQQYLKSSMRHNSNDSNSSNDLIIPEYLLKKFPFIQTLIVYSNLIMKSKYDFTFLNIILNNMFRNLSTEERGFRYEDVVRQFATSLYILGGRTAYEFIRLSIPAFLPTLPTAVVSKVTYDTTSNKFIGFALPLDDNGFPIANSYSTESFSCLEEWYSNVPRAKSLNAYLIQPLSSAANNTSPFLLSAYGTDNKFESSDVISRWHHIHQKFKAKDIRILGFSTDCDSRYLHAMRASLGFFSTFAYVDHPDLLSIDLPRTWSWFFMQHEQLYICFQDPVHICTKLRNRILSETTHLLLGDQLINIEPLIYMISNYSKLDHALVRSDINPKDRQNYSSAAKISSNNVVALLEKIPNSLGINIYLQAIRSVRLAYIEKDTVFLDRIYHAWTSVFIFRFWLLWINEMDKNDLDLMLAHVSHFDINDIKEQCRSKSQYFITYQSHFCVEINAHCLVYLAMLVCEGQLPIEALNIWVQNSQTCESTFRSARAISSVSSAGVNFTVLQFLNRINKLAVLQNIKNNTNQNHLHFPQHQKYLLKIPLELSRNGRIITIEEMSNIAARALDAFWSSDIDTINSQDGSRDIESENETNSAEENNSTNDCDSDE